MLGYLGEGISIRNFLSCGDWLVPRTNQAYGMTAWFEIKAKADFRVRDPFTYFRFRQETGEEGATTDGPVAAELRERGLSTRTAIVKKAMLHGRYPTSGIVLGRGPNDLTSDEIEEARSECHPFLHEHIGVVVYAMHNGMYEPYEKRYVDLVLKKLKPEAFTDSAVCCAVLTEYVAETKNEVVAAQKLFRELETSASSGAVVFTTNLQPDKVIGLRQGNMPLYVIVSKKGSFLASDLSIVRELEDEKVEVFGLRNGGLATLGQSSSSFTNIDNPQEPAHYGRFVIRKTRLNGVEMERCHSCESTRSWVHGEEKWDRRSTTRWSIWPDEELCLLCAAERAERQKGPIQDGIEL